VTQTVDVLEWGGFGGLEYYAGIPAPEMIADVVGATIFQSHEVQSGPEGQKGNGYMFTIPMQNKNATLGDQTFNASKVVTGSSDTGQIHFQIIHTPQ
jgi:hypothetical protein